jgi:glycosyltransferase involved in cell wall biosynthesis
VRIRVVGEGVEKPELQARARAIELANVVFHPSVSRTHVPSILAAADAGLAILWKGPRFADSLPTKLLETKAAARPVIVGAVGLTARIVRSRARGTSPAPKTQPTSRAPSLHAGLMPAGSTGGTAGRGYFAQHYRRGAVLNRLADIMAGAARTA